MTSNVSSDVAYLTDPLSVADKLVAQAQFEPTQAAQDVEASFSSFVARYGKEKVLQKQTHSSTEAHREIPMLNADNVHTIPRKSLVGYRCMVCLTSDPRSL